MVLAVQRQPTKLSFWLIQTSFAVRMAGLSQKAAKALRGNVLGEGSKPSLFGDGMLATHKLLKPCDELNQMTAVATRKITASMENFEKETVGPIELWSWVNHEMTLSITESVYGPKNPCRDPEVEQAFLLVYKTVKASVDWIINVVRDFEDNAVGVLSYPFPSVTCAKAYAGREKLVSALERYYEAGGLDSASQYLKARSKTIESFDLSVNDKSRFEAITGHALLANTNPTAFWTLYHLFSDPSLLEEVREQCMPLLTVDKNNGTVSCTIDIGNIRNVPILSSLLHESLRHYASGTGSRIVVEDTMLDNRFLLKKNAFIFMPNHSYHFNASAWGPTVQDFDALRFIKAKSHHAGAFRGFGGGANLCPGRFLAANQILSMCAMFALRYEITPVSGNWAHPGTEDSNMALIVHPPKTVTNVEITVRRGWEGCSWAFRM